jgi:hypothetical protein
VAPQTFTIFANFNPTLEYPALNTVTRQVSDPSQSAPPAHPPSPGSDGPGTREAGGGQGGEGRRLGG